MGAKPKKPKASRKPHNVRKEQYESFDVLFAKIADEPTEAAIGDETVVMPRMERLLRVMIDRAVSGNVRETIKLLQIMAKDPGLAATARSQVVMFVGAAFDGL